ncbi:hypothetical protein KP509_18G029900 [Ceratopteris richardii]|uniref:Uncharacterized protein n=1 Tax=Ceratopteris richardii TaxID=49495 RepID=A0A8T2SPZ9_CERRI|nr:hypothetical protein KP509_18G029600 [Ceratopteris richardii]KAH7365469.1 hypothetical protein KP509_18G029900 [Ceratopteris richardii]
MHVLLHACVQTLSLSLWLTHTHTHPHIPTHTHTHPHTPSYLTRNAWGFKKGENEE